MLRIDSTNTNFNATSIINEQVVASMNASTNDPANNAYININTDDMVTFKANMAIIASDIEEFVLAVMGGTATPTLTPATNGTNAVDLHDYD